MHQGGPGNVGRGRQSHRKLEQFVSSDAGQLTQHGPGVVRVTVFHHHHTILLGDFRRDLAARADEGEEVLKDGLERCHGAANLLHLPTQRLVFLPVLLLAFFAAVGCRKCSVVAVSHQAARALLGSVLLATLGALAESRVLGEKGLGNGNDRRGIGNRIKVCGLVLAALNKPAAETKIAGLEALVVMRHSFV